MSEQIAKPSEKRAELRGCVDTDLARYYEERASQIVSGEPTWMVRNNDSESGEVYDYYVGGHKACFIELDWENPHEIELLAPLADPEEFSHLSTHDSLETAVTQAETLYRPNPYK